MQAAALEGGFANPALLAAETFRGVMTAMAQPGTLRTVRGAQPPAPVSAAAGAVLLTLCDGTTPLHLAGSWGTSEVRDWIAFHTGAPLTPAADCQFALGSFDALLPLNTYAIGTSKYPDRSATLIIEMPALAATGATLTGPGIQTTARLSLPEVAAFQRNSQLFPLGLDFIFTCGDQVAALPRSTEVR